MAFSSQPVFSTPSAYRREPWAPIQTTPWTAQRQDVAASLPYQANPDVQILKQQLDFALRKMREYEDAMLVQATLSRQFISSLRTQNGIICPDCRQEVAHACSLPTHSSLQPLSRYERELSFTFGNLPGSQAHLTTCSTSQGLLFGEIVAAQPPASAPLNPSAFHAQTLPSSSSVPPSHSVGFDTYLLRHLTPSPMRAMSSHSPGPIATSSSNNPHNTNAWPGERDLHNAGYEPATKRVWQSPAVEIDTEPSHPFHSRPGLLIVTSSSNNPCNDNTLLGKRDLHDAEYKPVTKRVRQKSPEEGINTDRRVESQHHVSSNQCLSSFKESFPLLPAAAAADAVPVSPMTSKAKDPTFEESYAGWIIEYNSEVKGGVELTLVHSLDVGQEIECLKFSQDGKYLAVGFSWNGKTTIYDVQTGEKTCTLRDATSETDDSVTAVCFSPNSHYLATEGIDGSTCIWEISKKHVRNRFRNVVQSGGRYVSCIDFSPDARLVASGTRITATLEVWNWRDGSPKLLEELETGIDDVRFSPDGKYIAVGHRTEVLVWSVRTGQLVQRFKGHPKWVFSIAFTPDGTGLVSGSWDGTIRLWDLSLLRTDTFGSRLNDDGPIAESSEILRYHASILFVAVSSSSRWIIFRSSRAICFWKTHNAELHCELRWDRDSDVLCDVSPVGNCLASSSHEGSQILLWRFRELSG